MQGKVINWYGYPTTYVDVEYLDPHGSATAPYHSSPYSALMTAFQCRPPVARYTLKRGALVLVCRGLGFRVPVVIQFSPHAGDSAQQASFFSL